MSGAAKHAMKDNALDGCNLTEAKRKRKRKKTGLRGQGAVRLHARHARPQNHRSSPLHSYECKVCWADGAVKGRSMRRARGYPELVRRPRASCTVSCSGCTVMHDHFFSHFFATQVVKPCCCADGVEYMAIVRWNATKSTKHRNARPRPRAGRPHADDCRGASPP